MTFWDDWGNQHNEVGSGEGRRCCTIDANIDSMFLKSGVLQFSMSTSVKRRRLDAHLSRSCSSCWQGPRTVSSPPRPNGHLSSAGNKAFVGCQTLTRQPAQSSRMLMVSIPRSVCFIFPQFSGNCTCSKRNDASTLFQN